MSFVNFLCLYAHGAKQTIPKLPLLFCMHPVKHKLYHTYIGQNPSQTLMRELCPKRPSGNPWLWNWSRLLQLVHVQHHMLHTQMSPSNLRNIFHSAVLKELKAWCVTWWCGSYIVEERWTPNFVFVPDVAQLFLNFPRNSFERFRTSLVVD